MSVWTRLYSVGLQVHQFHKMMTAVSLVQVAKLLNHSLILTLVYHLLDHILLTVQLSVTNVNCVIDNALALEHSRLLHVFSAPEAGTDESLSSSDYAWVSYSTLSKPTHNLSNACLS